MKILLVLILSMTLPVSTTNIKIYANTFECENCMVMLLENDSGDGEETSDEMPTFLRTTSSYSSYMEAYFSGLTENYGHNKEGTCGYVALGMLLSYYDSYLNDSIIPEQYDVISSGEETNMIERDCSPGVLYDETVTGSGEAYYNNLLRTVDYSLHAKLYQIGRGIKMMNPTDYDSYISGGTNPKLLEEVISEYFNSVSVSNRNNYYIETADQNSEYDVKLFIKDQIDAGYPVLVGASRLSDNDRIGHAAICYSYTTKYDQNDPTVTEEQIVTNMTIYAHMGNEYGVYYPIESKYPSITSAIALKFHDEEHTHSYNYEVAKKGVATKYCYCSSNILTDNNTEWTEFQEPENFDGNLVVPNWVTAIGDGAFYNNLKLKTIDFESGSNLTIIRADAFRNCSNLRCIYIPKSVEIIGANAFAYCVNLENILIEDNSQLKVIGLYSFLGTGLTSFKIPISVEEIDPGAFINTPMLTSITIPQSVTYIYDCALSGGDLLEPGNLTIYTDCTEPLEGWDENWNKSIIYIPPSYASNPVFWGCELSNDKTYVVSFTKTDNNISNANAINGVNAPKRDGFEFGGWYTNSNFIGNGYTTTELLTLPNSTYYAQWIPLFSYELLEEGTYVVSQGETELTGEIIIPAYYNGIAVTAIADGAFEDCTGITSIIMSDMITFIGEGAFYGCSSLESVVMSQNVTVIMQYTFAGCSSLTYVELPNGVTDIEAYAFAGCGIEDVIIPSSVVYVYEDAFIDCDNLGVVVLLRTAEQGITEIDPTAFEDNGIICFVVFDEDSCEAYKEELNTSLQNYVQYVMYL